MSSLDEALAPELERLQVGTLYRHVRRLEPADGPRAVLDGRSVLIFGSNDYLGLAREPRVVDAARKAAAEWGSGATGSRLTTGCFGLHADLEQEIAALKGTEDALLFGSGYLAAVGTIPALAGKGDLILSDALNHACLIDGCRLSRAEVRVYRHGDAAHARELLADGASFRRRLLVTDGVFSMDGDLAPLEALQEFCEETDTWLMVDDAHGTGVLGATGAGTAEHLGLSGQVPIQMGTLSKALGAEGGFIAGSRVLIDYLRNRARSFIFSTAPVPATVAAARAALRFVREEPERHTRLREISQRMRQSLRELGFQVPSGDTPIVPVIVGEASRALRLAEGLEERGVWVPAIRPPTVPEGTARLRVSLNASHTDADLERALAAFHALR